MRIIRLQDTFVRPADVTQYTAGDEVSSHATAASVVLPVFNLAGFGHGHLHRAAISITPASGNLVITAADFALLVFKTDDVIAAVGDNVAFPISGLNRMSAVGKFVFGTGAWTNPLGALTASTSGFQEVAPVLSTVQGNSFEFTRGETESLTVVLQATAAWNPGNVANSFKIELEIDVD